MGAALGGLQAPSLQQLFVLLPAGAAPHLGIRVYILPQVLGLCLLLPLAPGELLLPLVQLQAPGLSVRLPACDIGREQLWGWGKQEGVATVCSHVGEGDLLKVPAWLPSPLDPSLHFATFLAASHHLPGQARAGLRGTQRLKEACWALYRARLLGFPLGAPAVQVVGRWDRGSQALGCPIHSL